jgi:hypothetical protein
MRIPASTIANGTAWAVLICLIAVAFVVVVILGPFGLIVLGLLTLFVCTSFSLREDAPTWGTEVFRSHMAKHSSPEQRAAVDEARRLSLAPLRVLSLVRDHTAPGRCRRLCVAAIALTCRNNIGALASWQLRRL